MMLVLAVRTDADRVYERALQFFTPDEIGEAFAAARGVASPTQLRTVMKQDGRDLLARFRALAPPQPTDLAPALEPAAHRARGAGRRRGRCSACRRAPACSRPAHDLGVDGTPTCGTGSLMILSAQSVPSAELRAVHRVAPRRVEARRRPDRRRAGARSGSTPTSRGDRAVEVTLLPPDRCTVRGATEVPSDEVGVAPVRAGPVSSRRSLRSTRTYRVPRRLRRRTTFDFARRRDRFAPRRRRQRARVPTAPQRSSPRSGGPTTSRCAARARRAPEDRDGRSRSAFFGVVLRVLVAARRRRSWRPRSRSGCSGSGAAGAPR